MSSKKSSYSTTEYAVQKEAIDVTQARRLLRLTLLAPPVVANLLANPDVAVNLENVLRRVMPLDWQAQRSGDRSLNVMLNGELQRVRSN